MGAHGYSESYAFDRRHALHVLRNTQIPVARKSAEIIVLPPRQTTPPKVLELAYPRSKVSTLFAFLVMIGLHVAAVAYFQFRPEPPLVQAKIPPMTVELARPQPVQPPAPEPVPPPPEPKVEQPKPRPVAKPKPVAPKPLPVEKPMEQQVVEPTPVAEPPQPAVVPVIPATADPGYLRNPAPEYPEFAQAQGWEGTVLLDVHVLSTGRPASVDIKQSSGRKILDTAAVQTVKGWKFEPAKQGDTPVDSWVEVPIEFKLASY